MTIGKRPQPTWRALLDAGELLLLPSAHDGLAARLIEEAGFKAYQIGMFSVVGAKYGWPDIDLAQFGENAESVREITAASSLPVLIDCDDGYGDVKNVVHTVRSYEKMGVAAIFLEDQTSPKRCGHMAGKDVIPAELAEEKIAAAAGCRETELFLIARTDARAPLGLDEALRRGERYLNAGADGLFIEAPQSVEEVEQIAKAFRGKHLLVNMLEGGGKTPLIPPSDLHGMGFSMVLYPTTLVFQITKLMQQALADILAGKYSVAERGTTFDEYEQALRLPYWQEIEDRYMHHVGSITAQPTQKDVDEAITHITP